MAAHLGSLAAVRAKAVGLTAVTNHRFWHASIPKTVIGVVAANGNSVRSAAIDHEFLNVCYP